MTTNNNIRSYDQIISLPTKEFIDYIYALFPDAPTNTEELDGIKKASGKMSQMAGLLVFFTEIQARVNVEKRNAKWAADDAKGNKDLAKTEKRKYEVFVDKDKIMDGAIKALETQYRAVNRATTIWMEAEKEKTRY